MRLTIGEPGSGKSVDMAVGIKKDIHEKRKVLAIDPHASVAREIGEHMVADGLEENLCYDRVSDEQAPGYMIFDPEADKNQKEIEDRGFLDLCMAIRGFPNSHEHPYYVQGVRIALLVMRDNPDVPFWKIRYALDFGSPEQTRLYHGSSSETQRELATIRRLTKHESERQVLPVVRLFKDLFSNSAVMQRLGGTHRMLERQVEIIEMNERLSDESRRVLGCCLLMRGILDGMNTGDGRIIYVDEASEMMTRWLSRKINECRKFGGMRIRLVDQSGRFDESYEDDVHNGCWEKQVFCVSAERVARMGAGWMLADIDPHKEHSRKKRYQQFHDGFETIPGSRVDRFNYEDGSIDLAGWTEAREVARPKYYIESFDEIRYLGLEDQIKLLMKKIMTLPVGTKMVRDRSGIYTVKVKALDDPYVGCPGLAEERFERALERMKKRSYFKRPDDDEEMGGALSRFRK